MKGFRKVLIALNGGMDALTKGIRLAQDERSWITVVKVVPPYEGDLELTGIKNIADLLGSDERRLIGEVNRAAEGGRALVKTRVEEGEIDKKIVEVAREERCDLIIMENDRQSRLTRLLGGNMVEKVVRRAPCPVLVVSGG